MTRAAHRRIIDVDGHMIEIEDFLQQAAGPEQHALPPKLSDQSERPFVQAGLAREHLEFVPFSGEPFGWIIEIISPDLADCPRRNDSTSGDER